jgi:hypothetical protein
MGAVSRALDGGVSRAAFRRLLQTGVATPIPDLVVVVAATRVSEVTLKWLLTDASVVTNIGRSC